MTSYTSREWYPDCQVDREEAILGYALKALSFEPTEMRFRIAMIYAHNKELAKEVVSSINKIRKAKRKVNC